MIIINEALKTQIITPFKVLFRDAFLNSDETILDYKSTTVYLWLKQGKKNVMPIFDLKNNISFKINDIVSFYFKRDKKFAFIGKLIAITNGENYMNTVKSLKDKYRYETEITIQKYV